MSEGDPIASPRVLSGVHPGDQRLAARIGAWLAPLPGRWRWAIERLLRWWFAELGGMVSALRSSPVETMLTVGEADLLEFSFLLSPDALGLVGERVTLKIAERTPFAADEVLAAYRLEEAGAEVKVMVRLAPLSRLVAAASDRPIDAVRLAAGDDRPMTVLVPTAFLDPALRQARIAASRRRRVVAATLALALVAVLLVPLWARREAVAREQAAIDEMRATLAPLVRRAAGAKASERAAAEAMRLKAAAPAPLGVLDRLTQGLGDDTYLTEFRLAERDGMISGITSQAAILPAPLEADPLLSGVRLTAPVSRDTANGGQRFEIGFRVAK